MTITASTFHICQAVMGNRFFFLPFSHLYSCIITFIMPHLGSSECLSTKRIHDYSIQGLPKFFINKLSFMLAVKRKLNKIFLEMVYYIEYTHIFGFVPHREALQMCQIS
ncbi:hypothetical protein ACJX0J_009318 [Zea mays]